MRVRNDDLEEFVRSHLTQAVSSVEIFSPFVTVEALRSLSPAIAAGVEVTVVVRWRLEDFVVGVADTALFEVCRELGWSLLRHPRIHLKSVLCDRQALVTGSANFTGRGLGTHPVPNLETLVGQLEAPVEYVKFLDRIRVEATPVDDDLVREIQRALEILQAQFPGLSKALSSWEVQVFPALRTSRACLISELPMSRDWESLYDCAVGQGTLRDAEEVACANHDLRNYALSVSPGEPRDQFKVRLRRAFFQHPFIARLELFIDRPRRFGAIKEWVQNTCEDVPIPSRRTLTGNVQVLYQWLVALSEGKYDVWRAGHSEVIYPSRGPHPSGGSAGSDEPSHQRRRGRRR